ncbi:MAG: agmatinase [Rhodospirillales bacterium]|nr:agmatinase [Rhodospirillales bacterium]
MKLLPPKKGFLGLSEEDAAGSAGKPGVTVVPFGLEGSVSYGGGTAHGPQAIIDASHQVELFDEELWREPVREFQVSTLAPFAIADGVEAAVDQLQGIVGGILDEGRFPLVFGGEHSLTAGAIRPFAARHEDLVILQFDAHADLRDGYEGEHYSHAAAMRRCLDNPGLSLVSLGIRNISVGEAAYLDGNRDRIHVYWGKDRRDWNLDEILSHLTGRSVYLTFDLDGFDASLMPATGTPEPGGMFWEDVIPVIRGACEVATVVGADICELAPIAGFHACDFLAAKLAHKILAYRFAL